jgi:hypothetical protein
MLEGFPTRLTENLACLRTLPSGSPPETSVRAIPLRSPLGKGRLQELPPLKGEGGRGALNAFTPSYKGRVTVTPAGLLLVIHRYIVNLLSLFVGAGHRDGHHFAVFGDHPFCVPDNFASFF